MNIKTRFSPEEEKSIVSDYLNGMPIQEIYTKWGIGNTILSSIRRRNGIEPRGCHYTEFQRKVLEYRKQGLCSSEIAELTGKDSKSVKQASKAVGFPFTDEESKKAIELSHFKTRRTEDYLKEVCSSIGFEYVGGYTGSDGAIILKCPECGTKIKRRWNSVRRTARGCQKTIICETCLEISKAEEEHRKNLEKKAQEQKQEQEREQKFWNQKFKQESFSFCQKCGQLFIARKNTKFCSRECLTANNNSRHKDKRLKRIKNVRREGVDLKKLYLRDNGVCWLCRTSCGGHRARGRR